MREQESTKEGKGMTPLRAIREHCLKCMGWDSVCAKPVKAVRECRHSDCPLHSYRLGKNPNKKSGKGDIMRIKNAALEAVLF